MSKLLLVDDDAELSSMLEQILTKEGFELTLAADGETGLERALSGSYDLILLDVMLPGIDGFQLLQRLRQQARNTPVLMLTARGDDDDRVAGLELGADDYLPKPFYPKELVARVKALLRRTPATSVRQEAAEFAGFTVDPKNNKATCDDVELDLTPTEFDILRTLVGGTGEVISKDQLSVAALGRSLAPFDRSLDVHVSNIRKKLPTSPERIQTVRGRGYRILQLA
ncbi:Transcriptional regulatory protein CpxR [Pseudidiomarina piscicola]|uniref:Transcriptional regulatory protein CpxR n=1 Tax=Pseudidiomarina piscicola TaxID=2614830 RepID=A0A6S6WNC6_9GAMM|nr:response regulator transcription factor [Pseudidiomarina piscicola]CAB0151401.1 Transcriptional regulatory protein CpxR [Pseudidiomarina piscicola]VZT40881.1 Transcriptional regulatory protein CpxR [Pseudomonas aeruginosa]